MIATTLEAGTTKNSSTVPGFSAIVHLPALLVGFVISDLMIATVLEIDGDELCGSALGVAFSQITLLAVWAAWAPVSVLIRLPVGFVGAALVSLSTLLCIGRDAEGVVVGAAAFLQWIAIQVPLWIIRIAFGWRLAWPNESIEGRNVEMQFGIRQLFTWTTLVAVTVGIVRLFVTAESLEQARSGPWVLFLLSLFGSLAAWPVIWAAFVRRWVPIWMLAAAACCAGICIAEYMAFGIAVRDARTDSVFLWISSVQFITSSGCLLVVRFCGFRLVRISRRSEVAKTAPAVCLGVLACFLLSSSVTRAEDKDLAPEAVERFNAIADREARGFSMSSADDANNPFELVAQPLLVWTNPVSGSIRGRVYLWTQRGIPALVASIYKYDEQTHVSSECHALARQSVSGKSSSGEAWKIEAPSLQFKPVPKTGAPSQTRAGRLTQMREIARRFTASRTDPDKSRWDLRLLVQPLYRYPESNTVRTDGAVFAFVQGTNPDVLLLIESGGESDWKYALARMHRYGLNIQLDGASIQDFPALLNQEILDRSRPYTVFRTQLSP